MKKQTKKNLFNMAIAGAVVTSSVVALAPVEAQAATSFKDLKTNNVHYNDIQSLVERNVLVGYPDGTFKVGQPVTRAHAALIIANILDLDTVNVTDPGFKDVPKSHKQYGAIAALANNKIISGYGNGNFGVNDTLTRGQMAVILQKAFELDGQAEKLPFTDAKGNFYESYISTLYANGVTAGMTPTTYGVNSPVTRGQLSTFVVKSEAASAEVVIEIKDGQLVTTKGTYAIDAELAKVFNAQNAAALKGAKIKLETEQVAVASLNKFFAAETTTSKVKLNSLTLVTANASFDAGGYSIPNVTVQGNNVTVKNVVADKINIPAGVTVELTGVVVKEIVVKGDSKFKLDATSKVEKLQLPAGKKIEDIISNYEEVKEIVAKIEVKDDKGEVVDPTPGNNTGGGGSFPSVPASYDTTVDNVIDSIISKYEEDVPSYIEDINFTSSSNTITVKVNNTRADYKLSDVKQDLINYNGSAPALSEIVNNDNIVDIATVYSKMTKIKFGSGEAKPKSDYIGNNLIPNKSVIISTVQGIVDDYQTSTGAVDLGDVVNATTTITFEFDGFSPLTYTLEIK